MFHFDLLVSPTCFRYRQTSQRLNRYQNCTNIDLYVSSGCLKISLVVVFVLSQEWDVKREREQNSGSMWVHCFGLGTIEAKIFTPVDMILELVCGREFSGNHGNVRYDVVRNR